MRKPPRPPNPLEPVKFGAQDGRNWIWPDGRQAAFFQVPMPPSANNIFANRLTGGRHVTEAYEAWRREAGWTLKLQKIKPFAGPVKVEIRLEPPRGRADIDNRIKPVLDLLQMMAIVDNDVQARWYAGQRGAKVILEQARNAEIERAEMDVAPDSARQFFDAARRREAT